MARARVKKDGSDRGIYRSIYVALWDDPDFQKLSSEERFILLYLRQSPLSNMPCIYKLYKDAAREHTGYSDRVLDRVLHTLCERGWIEYEQGIVWVKNALRYDPNITLSNELHLKAVQNIIAGLPKLKIVINFCTYYNIPIPYTIPSTIPIRDGIDKRMTYPIGNTDPEEEKEKDPEEEPEKEKELARARVDEREQEPAAKTGTDVPQETTNGKRDQELRTILELKRAGTKPEALKKIMADHGFTQADLDAIGKRPPTGEEQPEGAES